MKVAKGGAMYEQDVNQPSQAQEATQAADGGLGAVGGRVAARGQVVGGSRVAAGGQVVGGSRAVAGDQVAGRSRAVAEGGEKAKSGYEKIYEWVLESLVGFDLEANAEPLGLEATPEGGVIVKFFGRDYLVRNSGAQVMDGLPTSFNHLSLVAHYAISQGRAPATGEFVRLSALSGVPEGTAQGGYDREAISKPLARKYGHNPEGLEEAVARIGGRLESAIAGRNREYYFQVFPRIAMKLVFEEPDEEFGPEFTVYYDKCGMEYMEFEALAFLGGILTKELIG